ncbi:MAG: adenosylcobinamide-GDP ribazoletransferase [Trichlorobacter sp.]|jgi:adenosylcobinamide-GDP ribazoletransferase|nr:adenosylcobinamide-GDP ribazoletransferase [Trichlorobacter sp.]
MRLYLIALQFLTIIPLPFNIKYKDKDFGRSLSCFPLVGITIGGILLVLDALLSLYLPRQITDLLLLVAMTVITGALHLDGLADVFDGLAARGGRERFLAVMKDPRTGAVGVVGVVLGLLLKYELLLCVSSEYKWAALLIFPTMARFSQVQMAAGAKAARTDGLGALFINGAGTLQLVIAGITATALSCWLFGGLFGLTIFAAGFMVTMILKQLFHRILGGVTGDLIGCVSELNELLALLVIVAMTGAGR